MTSEERLSVIVPVLNEAPCIINVLGSLQHLRQQGHEVILADGGSTDATRGNAAPWVDRVVHSAQGRAGQMNAGAAAATGDILLFLHADTRLPVDATKVIVSALREDGCNWGRFNVRLSGGHWLFRVIEKLMNLRSCLTGIATGDQGIFVSKRVFQSIGGYADIPLMEDVDISRRLGRLGRPACPRTPVVTSSRRWETHGILHTVFLMWWLRLAYAFGVDPKRLARMYSKNE